MNRRSLKLRLLISAALAIALSLMVAGLAFVFSFQRYAEQLATRELENDFLQLVSGIRIDANGVIRSRAILSDPRFEKPYGGLYWQIDEAGQEPLRSRSLFDVDLPDLSKPNTNIELITGPNNVPLFALQKQLIVPGRNGKDHQLHVTMAVERTEINAAAQGFRRDLLYGLIVLSFALLAGSAIQILLVLRPLRGLEAAIRNVQEGLAHRLTGDFPTEFQPVANSMNALLEARETALDRARQRAGNMAHGLKTPLTVLHAVADDLERRGQEGASLTIRENAALIHDQVERQLTRARAASGDARTQTQLRPAIERVATAMTRAPGGDSLDWVIDVPQGTTIPIETNDLIELLGNLMDNARKWAMSRVRISYVGEALAIDDDGPGVEEDQLDEIEKRGYKLDNSRPGHGLGLAIVRELVDAYGMELKYQRSGLGGLSVSIAKPV